MEVIVAFWTRFSPEMQAAITGAMVTVGTATLGALLVVWQISRQARHAISQNRHNEALKLKLQLYHEVLTYCRAATGTVIAFDVYIQKFLMDSKLYLQFAEDGRSWPVPEARTMELSDSYFRVGDSIGSIMRFTEEWQVIDPRIQIIRTALTAAQHDLLKAYNEYFKLAVRIMPREIPDAHQQGTLRWRPPGNEAMQLLERLSSEVKSALMDLISFIHDCQIEMENLLVGELFGNIVASRDPADKKAIVVRLDKAKELTTYFNTMTEWGRETSRSIHEVEKEYQQVS